MSSLIKALGERLDEGTSRRGFLATVGKVILVGGAALAGLGGGIAEAACGVCPAPCCSYGCTEFEEDEYVGCCRFGDTWYETRACVIPGGGIDCYYVIETGPNCPEARG